MPPLRALRFLYVGTAAFEEDHRLYREALGAEEVWHFHAFGARVAAFRLSAEGPLWLLADHRPPGTCMPVYAVDDLEAAVAALRGKGWAPHAGPFGIPNGDCYTFRDASGNELALFEDQRPGAMEGAYAAEGNANAVRH
jgi:catechol 2,3-dioxygenase-like lactoylglutathione lyase family enzyme